MKEAIDAARNELKDRSAELETLRADGSGKLASKVAALRAERDKVYQGVAALAAGHGERLAGVAAAGLGRGPRPRQGSPDQLRVGGPRRGRAAGLHGGEDRPGDPAARPRDRPDRGEGRAGPARQAAPRTDGGPLRRPGGAAAERPQEGRRQGRKPRGDLRRPGRTPPGPADRPALRAGVAGRRLREGLRHLRRRLGPRSSGGWPTRPTSTSPS